MDLVSMLGNSPGGMRRLARRARLYGHSPIPHQLSDSPHLTSFIPSIFLAAPKLNITETSEARQSHRQRSSRPRPLAPLLLVDLN